MLRPLFKDMRMRRRARFLRMRKELDSAHSNRARAPPPRGKKCCIRFIFLFTCSLFGDPTTKMSEAPVLERQASESRTIPERRVVVKDPAELPSAYSETPGGTIFSTTPGGKF